MSAPLPTTEKERLSALHSYEVLDTAPEEAFDDLAKIASEVCGTSIALVSLIDAERQWFKARVGLAATETPRSHAFCAHAILDADTLVVPDATRDERFRDNPLVLGDPNIRFYAGAPLRNAEGHNLGTLCVIDPEPRSMEPLSASQRDVLEALSRQVVRMLEYRRVSAELADALSRAKVLSELVPICAWCKRIRDDKDFWSSIEAYLREHAGAQLTHGMCPDCERRFSEEDRARARS